MSDDCTVKHPPLTGLDRASMAAAYEASFVGAFGRKPTWVRGSGKDDGEYWIGVSDHYGAFGDGICRAGWSRYWELKMTTGVDALDPKLGDEPAHFLPQVAPSPSPVPAPLPAPDNTAVILTLAEINGKLAALDAKADLELATLKALLAQPKLQAPIYQGSIFGYRIILTPQETK